MADDDYMSDAFLKTLEDVRPGLKSRSQKRKDRASEPAKLEPKHKRIKAQECELREKALATPISTDNKGFSMLQKMGYKRGMGLGKAGAGVTDLIPLVLKDGKGGLGRERYVKEKVARMVSQDSQRFTVFRQRNLSMLSEKKIFVDLRRSQRACEQLDSAKGIGSPQEVWFWPLEMVHREEEEEEEEEVEEERDEEEEEEEVEEERDDEEEEKPLEQLVALTEYLRSEHFYCIWCGTTYEGEADLAQHCPGDSAEAHED